MGSWGTARVQLVIAFERPSRRPAEPAARRRPARYVGPREAWRLDWKRSAAMRTPPHRSAGRRRDEIFYIFSYTFRHATVGRSSVGHVDARQGGIGWTFRDSFGSAGGVNPAD